MTVYSYLIQNKYIYTLNTIQLVYTQKPLITPFYDTFQGVNTAFGKYN